MKNGGVMTVLVGGNKYDKERGANRVNKKISNFSIQG